MPLSHRLQVLVILFGGAAACAMLWFGLLFLAISFVLSSPSPLAIAALKASGLTTLGVFLLMCLAPPPVRQIAERALVIPDDN